MFSFSTCFDLKCRLFGLSVVLLASPNQYRSFGLTQKNQKVKAAPSGLLRFAAGGKWMKLASLKQHPFLVRLPRRSASRPAAEAGPFSSAELLLFLRPVLLLTPSVCSYLLGQSSSHRLSCCFFLRLNRCFSLRPVPCLLTWICCCSEAGPSLAAFGLFLLLGRSSSHG